MDPRVKDFPMRAFVLQVIGSGAFALTAFATAMAVNIEMCRSVRPMPTIRILVKVECHILIGSENMR